MLKTHFPTPALMLGSFLYDKNYISQQDILEYWQNKFGPSEILCPRFNPLKKYYAKEMGQEENLERIIFITNNTYPREMSLAAKLEAIEQEKLWSQNSKRKVNIDIGLLCLEHLVLLTTKPFSHRPYLGQGIYQDLSLIFENGAYQKLAWSYPDYVDEEKRDWFLKLRKLYLFNFM